MQSTYYKRFNKVLKEQDEDLDVELTDTEAADQQLDDISSDELGADVPEGSVDTSMSNQQKQMYDELNGWISRMDEVAEYLNGTEHEYSHNDGNGLVGNTRELHKCDILDSTGTSQLEDNGPTNEKASCIFRGGTAPTTYGEWFDVHPHVNNYYIGNSTNHTQYSNNYNVYDNYMSNTEPKYLQIFVYIAYNYYIDFSISIRKKPTS